MLDTWYWVLDTGCWEDGSRCSVVSSKFGVGRLEVGSQRSEVSECGVESGYWVLDAGYLEDDRWGVIPAEAGIHFI